MDFKYVRTPAVVQLIAERFKNGYSPVVLVVGKMRCGKTTKAFLLLQWLSWLIYKKEWDWKNNTIITIDQFIEKLDSGKDEFLLIDEVQRMFAKKDWYKEESRIFDKILTSQAYKHSIIFLVLPRASALGSDHIFNVDYVIYVKNRKLILPYKLDSNLWDIDLKKKRLKKFFLSHFNLDYDNEYIKKSFKLELDELSEFKMFINTNLKEKIMEEVKEQRGMINTLENELKKSADREIKHNQKTVIHYDII